MAKQAVFLSLLMLACGPQAPAKTGTEANTPATNTGTNPAAKKPSKFNVAGTYPLDLDVIPAVLPGQFQVIFTNLTRFMHDPNNAFKPYDAVSAPEGFVKWDATQMKIIPGGFCTAGDTTCMALGAIGTALLDQYFDVPTRLKIWDALAKLQTLRLETDLVITADLHVVGTTRSIGLKDSVSITLPVTFIDTFMTETGTDRYAPLTGSLAFSYSDVVLTAVEQQILPLLLPARFPRNNGTITIASFLQNLIDCNGNTYCETSKTVLSAVLASLIWNNTLVGDVDLPLGTTELVFTADGLNTQLIAR